MAVLTEPRCTCDPAKLACICRDIRKEPHLAGCPRWGTPYKGCGECTPDGNGPCLYGCMSGVVPVVRFDGGKPPHQVHFPTRPGWRWGWCDCPIGETHNENARP